MDKFTYLIPKTAAAAARAMKDGAVAKAGGIDLLDRMKEGVARPERVVTLAGLRPLEDLPILVSPTMAQLSAFATLREVAVHPGLRREYAALARAAEEAATPQIRILATVGGNLLQEPRCWYYRQEAFDCHQKGGSGCPAIRGENDLHAIFGNPQCPAVNPSNLAVALTALEASVALHGGGPDRKIDALWADGPFHRLEAGALLLRIDVPVPQISAYVEIRHRQTFEWALASAAVARRMDGTWSLVLGAVAPIPWRCPDAEATLGKGVPDAARIALAADAAVAAAKPLSKNGYKVKLARTALVRALTEAVGGAK